MRALRRTCTVSVLSLVFTLPVIAGEISTTVAPPSAPAQGEISTTLNGNIHTGGPGDMHTTETSADVTLAGVLVDLVQGVLALL